MADVEGPPEPEVVGALEGRDSSLQLEEEDIRPSTYTIRPKFEKK